MFVCKKTPYSELHSDILITLELLYSWPWYFYITRVQQPFQIRKFAVIYQHLVQGLEKN